MGTGINGAILLEFEIETVYMQRFVENSVKGFLDNYDVQPKSERSYYERYVIKNDILLPNYADFIAEFYGIIQDEFKEIRAPFGKESIDDYTKKVLSCKTREEFDNAFDGDNRNMRVPFIDGMSRGFSCLYCGTNSPFIFYSGSYKAFLEEYSTLVDMEKILARAMDNPLKTAVKFGIYG
jgi:hypothetical protein